MLLIAKLAFIAASVAYPILLWCFGNVAWIHILMATLFILRAIGDKNRPSLSIYWAGGLCFVCLAVLSIVDMFENAAFYYPVVVNLALFFTFGLSLRGEAIITKIARQSGGNMDAHGIAYTRRLTKVWCGMFIFNGGVALILAQGEEKIYWGVFCGIISYVLIGALFVGEYVLRKFIWKIG